MTNINVKKQLENVNDDLARIVEHIRLYSGVDIKDARLIDNMASNIAEMAAVLGAMARESSGNRSAKTLVKKVRSALGYTRS